MFRFAFSLIKVTVMLVVSGSAAQAQTEVSVVLAGHAALPSASSVTAPLEARPMFATAGKFTANNRVRADVLGSVAGVTFVGDPKHPRNSGGSLPINGQSCRAFRALCRLAGTSS